MQSLLNSNKKNMNNLQSLLNPKSNENESKVNYKECQDQIKKLKQQLEDKLKSGLDSLSKAWSNSNNSKPPTIPEIKLRKTMKGHFGKVYALSWMASGKHIVSASQDGKLMLWNVQTMNKKLAIPLKTAWVMTVTTSPNQSFIASGGLDNLVSLFKITEENMGWETNLTYAELQQHEGYISSLQFVGDKQILSSSGDGNIILWDVEYKQPKCIYGDHTGDAMSVDLHPDPNKKLFVSGSTDGTVRIWDLKMKPTQAVTRCFRGHKSDVNVCKWFPSGQAVASGSDDTTIRLWDIPSMRPIAEYYDKDLIANVSDLDFLKSGSIIFAAYDEEPYVIAWNTLTGTKTDNDLSHPARVPCLEMSSDGYGLATGSWDCRVRVWA